MSEFRNATERVEFDKDEGKSQLKYDHMLEVTDLKARIAELEAEVTKGHELQDAYCDRIAEFEARAEKAEAMVEKLIEAGRMMKAPDTIEEFHRGRRDYNALVAEWKEREK